MTKYQFTYEETCKKIKELEEEIGMLEYELCGAVSAMQELYIYLSSLNKTKIDNCINNLKSKRT